MYKSLYVCCIYFVSNNHLGKALKDEGIYEIVIAKFVVMEKEILLKISKNKIFYILYPKKKEMKDSNISLDL